MGLFFREGVLERSWAHSRRWSGLFFPHCSGRLRGFPVSFDKEVLFFRCQGEGSGDGERRFGKAVMFGVLRTRACGVTFSFLQQSAMQLQEPRYVDVRYACLAGRTGHRCGCVKRLVKSIRGFVTRSVGEWLVVLPLELRAFCGCCCCFGEVECGSGHPDAWLLALTLL